jgi:hypothetical protein
MSKGNDDLRIQAALGRLQQQSKQGTANGGGGGTSQLMVCQFLSKNFFPRVLACFYSFIHRCIVEFSNHHFFLAEIQ